MTRAISAKGISDLIAASAGRRRPLNRAGSGFVVTVTKAQFLDRGAWI
jgi:hypothetical protein